MSSSKQLQLPKFVGVASQQPHTKPLHPHIATWSYFVMPIQNTVPAQTFFFKNRKSPPSKIISYKHYVCKPSMVATMWVPPVGSCLVKTGSSISRLLAYTYIYNYQIIININIDFIMYIQYI